MSNPEKPVISYSYTGFQASLGDGSFPGTQMDADLAELQTSLAGIIAFVEASFRSDGVLKPTAAPDSAVPPGLPASVTGSKASGAALASLLTALAAVGIITDNTVA